MMVNILLINNFNMVKFNQNLENLWILNNNSKENLVICIVENKSHMINMNIKKIKEKLKINDNMQIKILENLWILSNIKKKNLAIWMENSKFHMNNIIIKKIKEKINIKDSK